MSRTLFMTALVLLGCEGFDPTGTYVGEATRSGEASVVLTLRPDGSGTMNTHRFDDRYDGVRVTVTGAGERLVRVQVGDFCSLPFTMGVGSGDHEGVVALDAEPRCPIRVPNFTGTMYMEGSIAFDHGDPAALTLELNGTGQEGEIDAPGLRSVSMSYRFSGQSAP